eukprot:scaffold98252_cov36-Phaeocystis_antarctica.AAC.1
MAHSAMPGASAQAPLVEPWPSSKMSSSAGPIPLEPARIIFVEISYRVPWNVESGALDPVQ